MRERVKGVENAPADPNKLIVTRNIPYPVPFGESSFDDPFMKK